MHFISFCLFCGSLFPTGTYECQLIFLYALNLCCGSGSTMVSFAKNTKKRKSEEISYFAGLDVLF